MQALTTAILSISSSPPSKPTKPTEQKDRALCKDIPKMRRQTHMHCTICFDVAESYSQKECYRCGSVYKWSIPWKNHREITSYDHDHSVIPS